MPDFRISALEGNHQRLDGGAMFGNAPRAVWEKWCPPDSVGRIDLACRSLLIEAGGKKILCETGIGAFFEPKMAERYGVQSPDKHLLLESLAKLGLKDADIDYVILSHLHFDHAGGLLSAFTEGKDSSLLFPNAKYVVGKEAWNRALKPHPRDKASFIPGLTEKLEASGRLIIVDVKAKNEIPELFPERLKFVETNGHTPGQMHTWFQGNSGSVFFAGDLVPGTAWVHLAITMGYDRYPELLIDEKSKVYEKITTQKSWLFYTHDSSVCMSHVNKEASGKYVPLEPQQHVERMPL